jgi:hypothetical protein
MKFDTDFLINSKLSTYFEFETNESDPFFCFFFFKNPETESLHKMIITEDLLPHVKNGQYLILQDLIYFNINSVYMKNLKEEKEKKVKIKIKGMYGQDFSQPKKKVSINELTKRLYSPHKKSHEKPGTAAFNNTLNSPSKIFIIYSINYFIYFRK